VQVGSNIAHGPLSVLEVPHPLHIYGHLQPHMICENVGTCCSHKVHRQDASGACQCPRSHSKQSRCRPCIKQKYAGSRPSPAESPSKRVHRKKCPVFVMMPLDTVHVCSSKDGFISDVQSSEALDLALDKIKLTKVQVSHMATSSLFQARVSQMPDALPRVWPDAGAC
jgi:hypothetical protein